MKAMLLYKTASIEQKPLSYEDVKIPIMYIKLYMIEGDWLDWSVLSK